MNINAVQRLRGRKKCATQEEIIGAFHMNSSPFRAIVIAIFVTTFAACTTTPDYMAQVQMPEQQEEQKPESAEQKDEKASGVPNWLW